MAKVLIDDSYLEDIADSIRAKNGTQTTYKPSQMSTAIDNLPSGGGGGTPNWSEIGYSSVPQSVMDDFYIAKDIYDNWDNTITSMEEMFADYRIGFFPLVDTSNVVNMNNAFSNTYLNECPLIDTSKVVTAIDMFRTCNIKMIPVFDTSSIEDMSDMFFDCFYLEDVPVLDTSSVISMHNMFEFCDSLSDDSLNNIMEMCINATSYAGTKTLSDIGIYQDQAEVCQSLSNYQAFINAGWATGY